MNSEEQSLIDGLFSRLRDAEQQTAQRDAQAEAQINRHLVRQPAAPYYMAQALLIQEAAIKRLDQRLKELEAQAQEPRPSSGGFLAGLFGGGQRDEPRAAQPQQRPDGWGQTRFSQPGGSGGYASNPNDFRPAQPAQAAPQGGGFMRGALQTAAGVAGGVMVADLLTSMFHHSQPQEIVEVIQEPLQQEPSNFDDSLQGGDRYADNGFTDTGYDDGGFNDDPGFFDDGDMFS
ncbi:DUF2076 domain-containing protein [Pseudomonas sp. ZM23]|uniref:DUF2076 domain-containing protein n=1 Tax=Pseudomonas triclosanedens TaxID=2961893 RepID=A0ABY6ZZR0_9PSED|nr:DUF2076 domain-containing protein [Pseudomonas triclosanedens]MCP8464042.1 DUF2076 domain-containing protein [Pseudomonas triclosanedens]MCP8469126.1 DUF2076 domain-containing protein [Pseudomonas triclosanedens]MCP8475848.1 DUF2076 domain-containing protein [Pseudomonas triclosanedens]WAI50449.1 DUF2076 domain-containing protein [Pseudomonas triclosanedens]